MEIGKDLVAASSAPLVLAILAEGEDYGYAILQRIAAAAASTTGSPRTGAAPWRSIAASGTRSTTPSAGCGCWPR